MARGGYRAGAGKRFYVYRIFDDLGTTLYIGKGSGHRQNKNAGGFGGCVGPFGFCPVIAKVEREMQQIGPRKYVAQQLLRFDPRHLLKYMSASNLDAIRQVAYGPRI